MVLDKTTTVTAVSVGMPAPENQAAIELLAGLVLTAERATHMDLDGRS